MKEPMARKATRDKLRAAGVDEDICADPELTVQQANQILRGLRTEAELEEVREYLNKRGRKEGRNPRAQLEDLLEVVEYERWKEGMEQCGPPRSTHVTGERLLAMMPEEDAEATEVVGESFHLEQCKTIWQRYTVSDWEARAWAVLVPEPHNTADPNSVAVYIDEQKVGHLHRSHAAEVQGELMDLLKAGCLLTVPCSAGLGSQGHIGITLEWDGYEIPDPPSKARAPRKGSAKPAAPSGSPQPQTIILDPDAHPKAHQRYYLKALSLILLYGLCFLPGLGANLAWYLEAKRIQDKIGRPPAGMGCLVVMFGWGAIMLLLMIVSRIVSFAEMAP